MIRSALARNIPITECYVDALGPSPQWQARLSSIFPTISFTVCPKADSLFKIVGAASIIAKVTRDRYIHGWVDPEDDNAKAEAKAEVEVIDKSKRKREEDEASIPDEGPVRGSGYPSGEFGRRNACMHIALNTVIDPRTQAFLKEEVNPVFGYKGVVRFSWATVKVILEKQGVECRW